MMWSLWITTFTHYSALKIRSIQFSEARHALMPVSWEMHSPAFKCCVDTHTDTDKVLGPLKCLMSGTDLGCAFQTKLSTSSLLPNGLVTWLCSDMELVSFLTKIRHYGHLFLFVSFLVKSHGVASGSDPQTKSNYLQHLASFCKNPLKQISKTKKDKAMPSKS